MAASSTEMGCRSEDAWDLDGRGSRAGLPLAGRMNPTTQGRSPSPPRGAPPITVIEPTTGWNPLRWAELREYRDLFYFFVWRDLKVLYKQTVLGVAWAVIRPVFSMIVFSVIFGGLAGVPSDGIPYPLFTFAALVPWTYFSTAVTDSGNSLVTNARILSKVYFPRLVIPMSPVFAKLVDFGVAFVILLILMAYYGFVPPRQVVVLPLLVLIMTATAAGAGMWLSSLAVRYRDVKHATQFLTQLLMYAAPVVWPVSLISEKFAHADTIRLVYGLYPMAGVIEGFRAALLGSPMPWDLIGSGAVGSLLLLVSGAYYFSFAERHFADVA